MYCLELVVHGTPGPPEGLINACHVDPVVSVTSAAERGVPDSEESVTTKMSRLPAFTGLNTDVVNQYDVLPVPQGAQWAVAAVPTREGGVPAREGAVPVSAADPVPALIVEDESAGAIAADNTMINDAATATASTLDFTRNFARMDN
jgi:hypothetical protein